jgi:hypothetical protein
MGLGFSIGFDFGVGFKFYGGPLIFFCLFVPRLFFLDLLPEDYLFQGCSLISGSALKNFNILADRKFFGFSFFQRNSAFPCNFQLLVLLVPLKNSERTKVFENSGEIRELLLDKKLTRPNFVESLDEKPKFSVPNHSKFPKNFFRFNFEGRL